MNVLLVLYASVLILLQLVAINGNGFSTQYRGHTQHPTLAGHCYYEELDLAVPLNGEILPVNHEDYCVKVLCADDYLLMIKHCEPQPFPLPGCQLSSGNFGVQFPECCPQLECPTRA
ncbi:uncharacterized protein DMAD_01318 [Drosophila madeirensis]|uniref:Single domain-containing protein n=1 Tax=Drosophila madeirensis TaxID=30013 RepID=A0AAU9G1C5_DROMD|nr:uncharacterized protein LOC117903145 [Drosophila subobscura]